MLFKFEKEVDYNKEYTIINVNAKDVKDIFYGTEGHEVGYPSVFILLNDGTVKGIDTKKGYRTGSFAASNISGLKDVEKIEQADVTPLNDSGYEAIVAITKDNSKYEILKKD